MRKPQTKTAMPAKPAARLTYQAGLKRGGRHGAERDGDLKQSDGVFEGMVAAHLSGRLSSSSRALRAERLLLCDLLGDLATIGRDARGVLGPAIDQLVRSRPCRGVPSRAPIGTRSTYRRL